MNAGVVRRHRYCATGTAGMAKVVQLPGHRPHSPETVSLSLLRRDAQRTAQAATSRCRQRHAHEDHC